MRRISIERRLWKTIGSDEIVDYFHCVCDLRRQINERVRHIAQDPEKRKDGLAGGRRRFLIVSSGNKGQLYG